MLNKIYSLKKFIPYLIFQNFNNEICLIISLNNLLFSLKVLKNHIGLQYKILSCISGVDFMQKQYRFNIVYEILSIVFNSRIRIKIYLNEYSSVYSITSLFINANWWEREIWDLYGIYFQNHSDLRRILNDYSFEGFPMRKDFPLSGYYEVRYHFSKKRVYSEKIQLTQDYRNFLFESSFK